LSTEIVINAFEHMTNHLTRVVNIVGELGKATVLYVYIGALLYVYIGATEMYTWFRNC